MVGGQSQLMGTGNSAVTTMALEAPMARAKGRVCGRGMAVGYPLGLGTKN